MALTPEPQYIADKSALGRLGHASVAAVLEPLILTGRVATCGIVDLEVLYSTVSPADFAATRTRRSLAFPHVDVTDGDVTRAIDVMGLLAQAGRHRAAGIPDLLLAAVAERANLTLMHYDQDFDHIALVTGQPTRWVVDRGSVP